MGAARCDGTAAVQEPISGYHEFQLAEYSPCNQPTRSVMDAGFCRQSSTANTVAISSLSS